MKKIILQIIMIMLLILLSGCKNKQNVGENTDKLTPTAQPSVTLPIQQDNEDEMFTLKDYYPMLADMEYIFEGQGNEYAGYIRIIDFLDEAKGRIQTRTNNGGSETVRVIEIKDGRLSVIKIVNECYYRDNLMTDVADADEAEVLLMEPLIVGTQWTLKEGGKRYISGIDVEVTTPSGSYKAIEVTTESEESTSKDYYAPQIGLVKSVFLSNDMEVTSSLKEIKSNTPSTQTIDIFYPDVDEKIYVEQLALTFRTNEETKTVLEEAISQEAKKDSYLPLTSINTKINSLIFEGKDVVSIDFSSELVSDMKLGSGYEALVLQSITNTLGNYYGVDRVLITVDGKPYESGHVLMKNGETFQVNMDNVVR